MLVNWGEREIDWGRVGDQFGGSGFRQNCGCSTMWFPKLPEVLGFYSERFGFPSCVDRFHINQGNPNLPGGQGCIYGVQESPEII